MIETWDYQTLLGVATERLVETFAHTTGLVICLDNARKLERLRVGVGGSWSRMCD